MDFDFTDDQEQLRDAVRKWVDKGYTFERRRGIVEARRIDRGVYRELPELGLAGLYISKDPAAWAWARLKACGDEKTPRAFC